MHAGARINYISETFTTCTPLRVIAELGARGRSTIPIEIGNPSSRENLDVTSVRPYVRTYVSTYVRPYAWIRTGDEFVFVLDLDSGKQ